MSFALCTASFERGSNNATISASNPGALTAWEQVDIGGTGSVAAYGTAYAAHGSLGAHLKLATSGVTALHWPLGTGTEQWGRCYLKPLAYPTGATNLIRFFSGASALYSISWDGSGQIGVGGSPVLTNPLPLNQWARLEWHVLHNSPFGIVDLRLFLSADSTIPDEVRQLTGQNTGSSCNAIVFGNSGSPGSTYELAFDQAVAAAAALPGPFPVSTIAPTVAGVASSGSTLYCDGGGWNNGAPFALSYQWTRDGSAIPGATSRSYTAGTADVQHTVGCTVTATGLVATNENASALSSNTVLVGFVSSPTGGSFSCRAFARKGLPLVVAALSAFETNTTDCTVASYITQADGTSKITLGDGSGKILTAAE